MAIIIKSPREIALMKEAGKVIIGLFKVLRAHTKPGISTFELDKIAKSYITMNGGIPSSKGYGGFPGNICISVNDCLVHGIPSRSIILKEGDIVSYDVVVTKHGYMADACRTYPVGEISLEAKRLILTTKEAFFNGVKLIKPGIRLGVVSNAIYKTAIEQGYTVTSEFTGHGIGRDMHEDPYVPNVGKETDGPILRAGMTLAIEPMINQGKVDLVVDRDGWTTRTKDGKLCAYYEKTVAVSNDGYEIITLDEGEDEF